MTPTRLLLTLAAPVLALAQLNPVVTPRGVINKFTQEAAPSNVPQGGIIQINGLNLGPPEGTTASGIPWPLKLGDVEVLINNRPAPVYSATPARVEAQIPFEVAQGTAVVVVRRAGVTSTPARVIVGPPLPAPSTAGGTGFGVVLSKNDGKLLTFSASGLGQTDPAVKTGEASPADQTLAPRLDPRAYVGGIPATVTAALSASRVGEYDITVELPAAAQPGDMLELVLANRAPGVRAAWSAAKLPDVFYVPLPTGMPDIRNVETPDLRGTFVLVNGARGTDGCYPSYTFDMLKKTSAKIAGCLTAANPNAATPFVLSQESSAAAAFSGPAVGTLPAGISTKVTLFNPAVGDPMTATLPAAAANIVSGDSGNFVAVVPGTPAKPYAIDAATAEVTESTAAVGGGAGGGGGGGAVNPNNLKLDLGDGVDTPVSVPVTIAQGQLALVVVDDDTKPTKAKIGVIDNTGKVLATRDFPAGWLPLLPEVNPAATPAQLQALRFRTTTFFEPGLRTYYVLSRKDGADAFVAFGTEGDPKIVAFPDGWFPAACTATVAINNLDLVRRGAIFAANSQQAVFKTNCTAQGFVLFDYAQQTLTAFPLPAAGEMTVGANSGELNNWIYGVNADPARRTADTLYGFDGVSSAVFSLALPQTLTSFNGITEVPELNSLLATGNNRGNGDGGLVLFDLDNQATRVFAIPDGFTTATIVGIFPNTRKLVAKGTKGAGANATGSQFLVYDLLSPDLAIVANPDGCAFAGAVPQQGGQPATPGQPAAVTQRINVKANTIEAVCFDAARKQAGMMVVRVH